MELTIKDIYNFLENAAKRCSELPGLSENSIQKKSTRQELRERGCVYSYGDILVECSLSPNDRAGLSRLFVILDEINTESKKKRNVMLSALVVTTTNDRLIPADKYFVKWHEIDPKNQSENSLISRWWDDVLRIWDSYN